MEIRKDESPQPSSCETTSELLMESRVSTKYRKMHGHRYKMYFMRGLPCVQEK